MDQTFHSNGQHSPNGKDHEDYVAGDVTLGAKDRVVTQSNPAAKDNIIVNRSKSGISPFVPIIKTPTYSENSNTLSGYSVEIEDPDTSTGFRSVGTVSPNYLLMTNTEVRSLALEIALRSGMTFKETRIFWDGRKFMHIIDFDDESIEVSAGDAIGLSLVTKSSYDKSWRFEMALMGKRFVCDNGMISGEFFARVGFRHQKSFDPGYDWHLAVKDAMSIIQAAPDDLARFVSGLRLLKGEAMTDEHIRSIWRLFPSIGSGIKGQIMERYVEREEPTLFGFLNAGTNVFWHREKMTASDFSNNDVFSTQMLRYAFDHLN